MFRILVTFVLFPFAALAQPNDGSGRIEPGQGRFSYSEVRVDTGFRTDAEIAKKFTPPAVLERCVTADNLSNGLMGLLVSNLKECVFGSNMAIRGKVDVRIRCENKDTESYQMMM